MLDHFPTGSLALYFHITRHWKHLDIKIGDTTDKEVAEAVLLNINCLGLPNNVAEYLKQLAEDFRDGLVISNPLDVQYIMCTYVEILESCEKALRER